MAQLALLEAEKAAFLSDLDGWSRERLLMKPSAEEWCALQVLDHLVRTEEEILGATRTRCVRPHRIGLMDRVRHRFILKVFQTDRKVKVPASAPQVLPSGEFHLDDLCQRWQQTREEFLAFTDGLSPEQRRMGIFRHPVIGWMGVEQITDFFWVHAVHHRFQIKRLQLKTGA